MELLILSSNFPNPTEGSTIRMYYFLKYLSKYYDINLVSFVSSPEIYERYHEDVKNYCVDIKTINTPISDLSFSKLSKMVVKNTVNLCLNRKKYQRYGLLDPSSTFYSSDMARVITNSLLRSKIKVILSDCAMSYYTSKVTLPKIVDATDAVSKLWKDLYLSSTSIKEKVYWGIEYIREIYKEYRIYNSYDRVLVVTDVDRKLLAKRVSPEKLRIIQNGVDISFFRPSKNPSEDFPSVVYLGHMGDLKNIESILYFYNNIFKIIKEEFPEIKLYIIGKNPDITLRHISEQDKSVIVTGFVNDIRDYLANASVFVVPTIYGSGIKNKMLEALAMGKPVVSTSIGAFGINGKNERDFLIADNPKEFAERVIELLNDKELRKRIGANARKLMEEKYSWERITERMDLILKELVSRK